MAAVEQQMIISVRGEARDTIDPDRVELACEIVAMDDDAAAARRRVVETRDELVSALRALGSVVATAETRLAPLTHLVQALSVGEYWEHDLRNESRRTQRAALTLSVVARDFDALPAVLEAVTGRDGVSASSSWAVDRDNPSWTRLRSEAVQVAVRRARDYAAGLGGSLLSVSELADGGLLSHGADRGSGSRRRCPRPTGWAADCGWTRCRRRSGRRSRRGVSHWCRHCLVGDPGGIRFPCDTPGEDRLHAGPRHRSAGAHEGAHGGGHGRGPAELQPRQARRSR